jgi:hypothetical protein
VTEVLAENMLILDTKKKYNKNGGYEGEDDSYADDNDGDYDDDRDNIPY